MVTERRIRLAAPDEPAPDRASIPLAHALGWRSPFERDDTQPSVSVFMTQQAFVRCCAHAGSDLNNEVGGGLVGKWRADERTGEQFIVVEAMLPARHVRHGSTFLTFTQDTQVALHDDLDERFPDKELVGWFHTHPRMGIFLSSYDVWLHENFFPKPWQVALVIEPHSAIGGFFVRQPNGRLDPQRYFGFYELLGDDSRSVVHWGNLQSYEIDLPIEGETEDE